MNNIYIKITMCLVLVVGMFSSCNDLLEQEPINTVSQKLFWRNSNDVQLAVSSIYSIGRSALEGLNKGDVPSSARHNEWGDYFVYGDMRSGDWITPNGDSDWQNLIENNLRAFPALRDLQNWRLFFRVIEQCNLVIDRVPGIQYDITEEQKTQAIAEAYFWRGFIYLYMVRIWGDVPLNLVPENVDPLPREDKNTVLDQAIEDLEFAEANLPKEYLIDGVPDRCETKSRATKGAANAVLAHCYMWKGEYENAVAAVDKIQKSNVYTLLPATSYREIFDDGCSDEGIFEIFYSFETGETQDYYGSALTWFFIRPFTPRGELSAAIPKSTIQEMYPYANDARVAAFFMSIGGPPNFEVLPDPLANEEDEIMFAKYQKRKDQQYLYDNNIMLFRYAGLLLLRAEASARLGNSADALTHLNMVRQRAGIADFSIAVEEALIEEIMAERRRELVGESHRFYDLLRTGTLHKFTQFITKEDEERGAGFWPVNDEAFVNNPKMRQNQYWQ